MNSFVSYERMVIMRQIVRMNRGVICSLLSVFIMLSTLGISVARSAFSSSAYTIPLQTTIKQQPNITQIIQKSSPAPTATLQTDSKPALQTPKAPVAAQPKTTPAPVVQQPVGAPPVPKTGTDFTVRDTSMTGWPIADNVALDATVVLTSGYDTSRAITLAFTAPEGYYCPMVTLLPFRTVHTVSFTCYLPVNRTMGHNSITISATNGINTAIAIYDLNIVSPTARS